MHVQCANCGEELLGSVNRCWKCGQRVVSTQDSGEAPPVRRSPVKGPELSKAVEEELPTIPLEEDNEAADNAQNPDSGSQQSGSDGQDEATASDHEPVEAPPQSATVVETPESPTPDPEANRARGMAAAGSLLLGLTGFIGGVFSGWFLPASVAGLAAGFLGLWSELRKVAIAGLLLSVLGVLGGTARGGYELYQWAISPPVIESTDGPTKLPDSLD